MRADNRAAVAFFYRHAGWGYRPGMETARRGRYRGAVQLASAEAWARAENVTFEWSDDWEIGSHVREFGEAYSDGEPETCENARAVSPDEETLASLGCIDDADAAYRRVINAELALEAMDAYESEPAVMVRANG